jgi:transposase
MRRRERQLLQSKLRTSTLPVRLHQRYRIVVEAARGFSGPAIADRVGCDVDTVFLWVHQFNTSGFETFERPTNPNGRASILKGPQIRELVKVALSRPVDLGLPFTEWSTAKLSAYCKQRGLLPAITDEWVRRVLRREGITPQRLKTWKQSPDPAFEAKNAHPPPLRAAAPRRRGDLFRRMGAAGIAADSRRWAGSDRPSPAPARHVSPHAGDGTVSRIL